MNPSVLIGKSVRIQAGAVQDLIANLGARVVLVPHVVCDSREGDDDLGYLRKIRDAVAPEHRGQVALLDNDAGFIGVKKELARCDLVVAARMHCAVNALAARVPAIFLSYSRKSVGMCRYVYGSNDWVMLLDELATQGALERKVKSMLQRRSEIHAHLAKRIPEIQRDARRPMTTLRGLLAG